MRGELDRLASIHEAQFGTSINGYGYWENLDFANRTGMPHFFGFALERRTAATPKGGEPAFRLVCAIVPSKFMVPIPRTPPADERIFLIKPVLAQTNSSKAKLLFWDKLLDTTVNITLGATWIDENQVVHQDQIATAQFDIEGYDLSQRKPLVDDLAGKLAGWFGGVPVSVEIGKTKYTGNGNFKLAVSVTEKDSSRIQEAIERAAKYVGDNKNKFVQFVTPKQQGQ